MGPFVSTAGGTSPPAPPGPRPRRLGRATEQQEAIFAALAGSSDAHLVVEARAGTGKSSTCREAQHRQLEARPDLRGLVRYAVFNKQNADEFRADCPPGVEVGTVHAFGYAVLRAKCGATVEKNKTYLVLDESAEGARLPRYLRKSVAALASHAKNQGLDPRADDLLRTLVRLASAYDVNAFGREQWLAGQTAQVLRRSAEWTSLVDFDDMIWLPGLLKLPFPECAVLYLDEVQDWNPAQHRLVSLLCPEGRVVAVGDRYQSIYQFRGADQDSIPNLERQLGGQPRGLERLPLTITWRCPRSHVALAQEVVPDLQAAPNAAEGTVAHLDRGQAQAAYAPGDMVLCAANAPLVGEALGLIASRRRAIVRGRAVGEQLHAVVRAAGDCRTVRDLARGVEDWRNRELSRLSALDGADDLVESVLDRAAGVQAVLESCTSPADAPRVIDELFSETASPRDCPGAVVFSTIHRAKGLEADRVFLLEVATRAPRQEWEAQQRRNLRYVALTRSKRELTFVTDGKKGEAS